MSTSNMPRKLQILCLHGSRSDGEVFEQRLKTLRKKLQCIADLHFVSAPHELPLAPGQSVPMRAWWRHWNLEEQQQLQVPTPSSATSAASDSNSSSLTQTSQHSTEKNNSSSSSQQQHLPVGAARQQQVSDMLAAGWDSIVVRDWQASLDHLTTVWQQGPASLIGNSSSDSRQNSSSEGSTSTPFSLEAGPSPARGGGCQFDGLLGFSNGAAAAFLFAAHAAANRSGPLSSLQFVILAGGYVPEPLQLLAPGQQVHTTAAADSAGAGQPAGSQLVTALALPSLHVMGSNDPLISLEDGQQLLSNFQEEGRLVLVHDSGHCVPQQARHCQTMLEFLLDFAPVALHPHPHHHRQPQARRQGAGPTAATAGAGVPGHAVAADQQLHRQGLKGTHKGPFHPHHQLRLEADGVLHQHLAPRAPHRGPPTQQLAAGAADTAGVAAAAATALSGLTIAAGQAPGSSQVSAGTRGGAAGLPAAKISPHKQQQQQRVATSTQPAGRCLEAGKAPAGGLPAAAASTPPAIPAVECSADQREELEALEAIFMEEFTLITTAPACFTVKLREPGTGDQESGDPGDEAAQGPVSRHFTLKFTLPQGYPAGDQQPQLELVGPLGANNPLRGAAMQHFKQLCAEQQEQMGGAGYIYPLVEALKEWIDEHIPADAEQRRAGREAGAAAADSAVPAEEAGPDAASSCGVDSGVPWWEKDEADSQLIKRAIAEAAAAGWNSWSEAAGGSSSGTGGEEGPATGATAAEGVGLEGDGRRGRWDYVIGLVGKPSAGKSTFFNAVTDAENEADAAKVAAYPFTTINPNVGRGFVVLPDPAPLLGLPPEAVKASWGHALDFDLDQVNSSYSRVAPLQRLLQQCGWGRGMWWRRLPVTVKDVAGLVPGAYQGRGRGNAFLNDLCDADVLVHVVDASGTTDREGAAAQEGEGADPCDDVCWVREELHRWVFDNVRVKWPSVLRRPTRLADLFTGYHATPGLVAAVLSRCGIKLDALAAEGAGLGPGGSLGGVKAVGGVPGGTSLAAWGEWELHRLVAHFLAGRFPILLALNKADVPGAAANIQRVLSTYPHDAAVAMSAAGEHQLLQWRRAGLVRYSPGAVSASAVAVAPTNTAAAAAAGGPNRNAAAAADAKQEAADEAASSTGHATAPPPAAVAAQLTKLQQAVLQPLGGTGALAALTCALALKPPVWAFPISDRESCAALAARHSHSGGAGGLGTGVDAKARAADGAAAGVLRDCVLLKPGSTVEDLYQVLKRPPYMLLEGDFVRAEARVLRQHTAAVAQAVVAGGGPAAAAASSQSILGSSSVSSGTAAGQQQQQSRAMETAALRDARAVAAGVTAAAAAHAESTGAVCRVLRKEEAVGPSSCVLLVQTNRKAAWQGAARSRAAAAAAAAVSPGS